MSFYKSLEKYAVGTGSKRVHEALFLTIPICIPSIREQQKIANFLTALDKKIALTTTQLEKTRQYKTALLQQLLI
jgi:type I restriction enzyme S subunit